MVSSSEDQDELSFFVFSFVDFDVWVFLFEEIGVDQGRFVSQELGTFSKMLGEESFSFFF